jgi:hypothetical protein
VVKPRREYAITIMDKKNDSDDRRGWLRVVAKVAITFKSRRPPRYDKMLPVMEGVKTKIALLGDLATFLWLTLRSQSTLAAGNLFLCEQLAMFQERKAIPRRPDTPIRIALVLLH